VFTIVHLSEGDGLVWWCVTNFLIWLKIFCWSLVMTGVSRGNVNKPTKLAPLPRLLHRFNLLVLLSLIPVLVGELGLEMFNLELRQLVEHELQPRQGNRPVLVEISP
jgi:hypothetical protein